MEKMRYIKYNVSVCQVCISRQMPKDSRVTCQLSVIVILSKMSVFVNSMLISANTARQHAEGLSVVCVGSKYFVGEFKILAYESNAKNTRCQIPKAKKYQKPKNYSLDGRNEENCILSKMSVFVNSLHIAANAER